MRGGHALDGAAHGGGHDAALVGLGLVGDDDDIEAGGGALEAAGQLGVQAAGSGWV